MAIAGNMIGLVTLPSCSNLNEPELQHPITKQSRQAIPKRSRQAIPDLIDLTDYYTASLDDDWLVKPGANLSHLPQGVHALAQVAFDVRGLIQLAGKAAIAETGINFPKAVKGIKINFKGRRLHFLHGAAWSVKDDTKIGDYVLHYANGQTVNIPIVYQRNIRDWFIQNGDQIPTDADIAWSGENEASHKLGYNIQLYKYTANNPFPDVEIETIDIVSTMTESGPFLIALTVEPNKTNYEGFRSPGIDNAVVPRSPQANADLVDLSNYYNYSVDDDLHNHPGHDLQDLPKGVQALGGETFDVRGLIQLASSRSLGMTGVTYPEAVKGIKVNRKGRRIHFLHACGWSAEAGAKIGEYVIHYVNGQTRSVPIIYQHNMLDWWFRPEDAPPTEAEMVWQGENPSTRANGYKTRLLKYSWDNPLPEVEISTIDFVSSMTEAGPFLVAVTIG